MIVMKRVCGKIVKKNIEEMTRKEMFKDIFRGKKREKKEIREHMEMGMVIRNKFIEVADNSVNEEKLKICIKKAKNKKAAAQDNII